MRMLAPPPLLVVTLLVLTATEVRPATQENVRAAIEANNRRFVAAAAKADPVAIAELYTSNAQAYPPNADIVQGRPAIQALWKSVLDSGIANVTLTTRDVESQGDLAFESGAYEMQLKDGKSVDRGKYIVVWKRESGQWKIHQDIWNTSMPAK